MERFLNSKARRLGSCSHPAFYLLCVPDEDTSCSTIYLPLKRRADPDQLFSDLLGGTQRLWSNRFGNEESFPGRVRELVDTFCWIARAPPLGNPLRLEERIAWRIQRLKSGQTALIEKKKQKIEEDVRHQCQQTTCDRC
nr:Chromosome 12 open reading frame 36 [Homo sapiens]BAC03590.1 unnamed protein product [Homo sapiens]